jgi:hypothetical protein
MGCHPKPIDELHPNSIFQDGHSAPPTRKKRRVRMPEILAKGNAIRIRGAIELLCWKIVSLSGGFVSHF